LRGYLPELRAPTVSGGAMHPWRHSAHDGVGEVEVKDSPIWGCRRGDAMGRDATVQLQCSARESPDGLRRTA